MPSSIKCGNHLSSLVNFLTKDVNVTAFSKSTSDRILAKSIRKRDNIYCVIIINIVNIANALSNSTNTKKILIYHNNGSFITSGILTTNRF